MSVHYTSPIWKLELPPAAKMILLKFGDNATDEGYAWPKIGRVARESGYGESTVREKVRGFRADKVLVLKKGGQGGRAADDEEGNRRGSTARYWIDIARAQELYRPGGKGFAASLKEAANPPESGGLANPPDDGPNPPDDGANPPDDRHPPTPPYIAEPSSREPSSEPSERRARGTRLAEDWQPDAFDLAYGRERGFNEAEIEDHAANFKTYFTAGRGRSTTHLRWSGHGSSAFATWLRKERPQRPPGQPGPGPFGSRRGAPGRDRQGPASVVAAVDRIPD